MKTILCFTLTLLTFVTLAFVPNSFAQDETPEYVVRVIYFIPNDRQPKPGINAHFDRMIRDAQQFYADVMRYHGFGEKTFRFETDDSGKTVVHHVTGKSDEAAYNDGVWKVWSEIDEKFDTSKNIYLIALDTNKDFGGRGIGYSLNGHALVPAFAITGTNGFTVDTELIIHELGHAFGLVHDARDQEDLVDINLAPVSQGLTTSIVSASFCAAEWLDVHRYFNDSQNAPNNNTNVQMFPPHLAVPPLGIRLQFTVTDPDGLVQAQLATDPSGDTHIIGCKKLDGSSNTVEFLTTQLLGVNKVWLRVIDKHGNFTTREHTFSIDINPLLPPSEVISIPDPNVAFVIREIFNLTSSDPITLLHMQALNGLNVPDRQITDLTGLEHAINIRGINLRGNQVNDITPLSELTKLTRLTLSWNQISDITPLKRLTSLEYLNLRINQISDITPLANMTNLNRLLLERNQISDITPLKRLTSLEYLRLGNNQISDITPLANMTNLNHLEFQGNQISDITPLKGLTKLTQLLLGWNQISDITPLAELINLEDLQLRVNQISDITPLSGLIQVKDLNLIENQISDVNPIIGLKNLENLHLQGNPIKNRKPLLELLEKNPDIKIYLKSGGEPLPVTLSHFRAEHTDAGVLLKWTTESEIDNAGFFIYRSATKDGEFKVVNPQMIQGAGTTGERNAYTWTDTTAKPNTVYFYQIEDVSHAGVRKQLATVRLRGLVSAKGKLTTRWADLKMQK